MQRELVNAEKARAVLTWMLFDSKMLPQPEYSSTQNHSECSLIVEMIDYVAGSEDKTSIALLRARAYEITRLLGEVSAIISNRFPSLNSVPTWLDVTQAIVERSADNLGTRLDSSAAQLHQALAVHLAQAVKDTAVITSIDASYSTALMAIALIVKQINEHSSLFTELEQAPH
ncbi:MAG TPA: hypothetical protein V6C84_16165 [Coleofasciculaceae cyanobacterium]|jgi:hypothetical protein